MNNLDKESVVVQIVLNLLMDRFYTKIVKKSPSEVRNAVEYLCRTFCQSFVQKLAEKNLLKDSLLESQSGEFILNITQSINPSKLVIDLYLASLKEVTTYKTSLRPSFAIPLYLVAPELLILLLKDQYDEKTVRAAIMAHSLKVLK